MRRLSIALVFLLVLTTYAAPAQVLSRIPVISDEVTVFDLPEYFRHSQQVPAIASNGTTTVVTWREVFDGIGTSAVYARRLPSGRASRMSTSTSRSQHFPAIAAGTTSYLVVWVEGAVSNFEATLARLLDGQGNPVHAEVITLSHGWSPTPSVAFNGESYLVVWTIGYGQIVGQRISERGELMDSQPFLIGMGSGAKVASNGRDFLVTGVSGGGACSVLPGCRGGISAVRVSGSGTVLDAVPFAIATSANWILDPAVSSNASQYLVTYVERNEFLQYFIVAKRLSATGVLLDGPPSDSGLVISAGEHRKANPVAAWDGEVWLAIWEDARAPGGNDNLYGSYVSPDLINVSSEIPIANSPTHEGEPDLAVVAHGRLVVLYGRIAPEYGGIERAFVRYIGFPQRTRPARR